VTAQRSEWYEKFENDSDRMIFHLMLRPKAIPDQFIEDILSQWYDALGVGQAGSIIWNAIPFSFVLDWFWGLGDFVSQFGVEAVNIEYEIVDFGYSYKRTSDSSYNPHLSYDSNQLLDWIPHGGTVMHRRSSYVRRRLHAPVWRLDDTEWSHLWDFRLPSWKQAFVGLNLVNAVFGK
jgi:hypothetical protein